MQSLFLARRIFFHQTPPVHPVSESKGGSLLLVKNVTWMQKGSTTAQWEYEEPPIKNSQL